MVVALLAWELLAFRFFLFFLLFLSLTTCVCVCTSVVGCSCVQVYGLYFLFYFFYSTSSARMVSLFEKITKYLFVKEKNITVFAWKLTDNSFLYFFLLAVVRQSGVCVFSCAFFWRFFFFFWLCTFLTCNGYG